MVAEDTGAAMESLEDFAARARDWAAFNLNLLGATSGEDRLGGRAAELGLDPTIDRERGRAALRLMHEAGFSGIVFPREYGGQGLPISYLHAFNAAVAPYDLMCIAPWVLTLGMDAPAVLEYGTEEQKREFLPRMFRGDDLWVQFLSEPTGGSDLAGALTRADRDGDEWVLNGSKIWTSLASLGNWGMCVARTDWDVPKHAGLSVFLVPLQAEGLTIIPLKMATGDWGFCQEYFEDVRLPAGALLGDLNNGWTIASRLLAHERNVLNGSSTYYQLPPGAVLNRDRRGPIDGTGFREEFVKLARSTGQADDPNVRQLVAEAYANAKVGQQVTSRVGSAMRSGDLPPAAGSILKLMSSQIQIRRSDITMEIAGPTAVVWEQGGLGRGEDYLTRQGAGLASGTSEIQRNIIGERLLGLPRETVLDRDRPFRDVRHNRMPTLNPK